MDIRRQVEILKKSACKSYFSLIDIVDYLGYKCFSFSPKEKTAKIMFAVDVRKKYIYVNNYDPFEMHQAIARAIANVVLYDETIVVLRFKDDKINERDATIAEFADILLS